MSDANAELAVANLGQQSFWVAAGRDALLVDPLLTRSFGTSPTTQFEIYPPRLCQVEAMPEPAAIVLTNEHLDHTHVPTLSALPVRPTIVCGSMMPSCVIELLRTLEYPLEIVEEGQERRFGALAVRLYRGGAESMLCEKRVYNVHVQRNDQRGIVFQSDAVIGSSLRDAVASGELPAPQCVVVTDNSQISLPGSPTPWANSLPPSGLLTLRGVISAAAELGAGDVLVHASGYLHPRLEQGPYLWADHRWVAELIAELPTSVRVHGLDPWECLCWSGDEPPHRSQLDWVKPDSARRTERWQAHEAAWKRGRGHSRPVEPLLGDFEPADESKAYESITAELERMAAVLRGASMLASASSLGSRRAQREGNAVLIKLRRADGEPWQWCYDRHLGRFVERRGLEVRSDDAPFGLEVHATDFYGLLSGRLQIWELVTCGIIAHVSTGPRVDSLIAFLFAYFGEQMRPELAERTFACLLAESGSSIER